MLSKFSDKPGKSLQMLIGFNPIEDKIIHDTLYIVCCYFQRFVKFTDDQYKKLNFTEMIEFGIGFPYKRCIERSMKRVDYYKNGRLLQVGSEEWKQQICCNETWWTYSPSNICFL